MGWKDILRPIRDRLRDNLPSHRTPDKNEEARRREQQQKDVLRGFAYFYTFEEIEKWTPEDVDPLQCANTPLLPRPSQIAPGAPPEKDGKAGITIIHDFAGNYHSYEDCHGTQTDCPSYSCEYLQFVDSFVYFSHKLVCAPPPSQTNTLHRNGVRSLGTFIVEPQTSGIEKMLEARQDTTTGAWEYPLARTLTQMAHVYGFDGWLLNIEKTFPVKDWNSRHLEGFLCQLRAALGQGNVIWYDALTDKNTVNYQNGLTPRNVRFAKAAGSVLTNYAWSANMLAEAQLFGKLQGMPPPTIAFGIDVWAQNRPLSDPPRKTFPEDGGGGTGTGCAVKACAAVGFTAGIFAPAWTYEHFPNHGRDVERAMWEGVALPDALQCGCDTPDTHSKAPYQDMPIARFARESAAGSGRFFYTNFERAFQDRQDCDGRSQFAHVGAQAVLPLIDDPNRKAEQVARDWISEFDKTRGGIHVHCIELRSNPPRAAFLLKTFAPPSGSMHTYPPDHLFEVRDKAVRLYNLSIHDTTDLDFSITYTKRATPRALDLSIHLGCPHPPIILPSRACNRETLVVPLDDPSQDRLYRPIEKAPEDLLHLDTKDKFISHISVMCGGLLPKSQLQPGTVTELFEIHELCIKKRTRSSPHNSLTNLRLVRRAGDCMSHTRLAWNYLADETQRGRSGMPYSDCTGPFSYFRVYVGEVLIGRVYALACVVPEKETWRLERGGEVKVRIEGYGFDGKVLCEMEHVFGCTEQDLDAGRSESDEWQMVRRSGSLYAEKMPQSS